MKIAIIGSRTIKGFNLEPYIAPLNVTAIISGGATGVDTIAAQYAHAHGIELVEFRPNYALYGKGAPHIRNRQIVDTAECVIAIWDNKSKGTQSVIEYAKKKNKRIIIITPHE